MEQITTPQKRYRSEMKLRVKPERLGVREFNDRLEIMRLWPDPYKKQIGSIIRHIAYLDEKIEKLELQIRDYEQAAFFESQAKAANTARQNTTITVPTKVVPPSRGERIYNLFMDQNDSLGAYLRIHRNITKEELKREANVWAKENKKELVL